MLPQMRTPVLVLVLALFAGPLPSTLMGGRIVAPVEEEEKSGAESGSPRVFAPEREQAARRQGRGGSRFAPTILSISISPTVAGVREWCLRAGPSAGRAAELACRFGCGAVLLI
jgi:hypothetical protein